MSVGIIVTQTRFGIQNMDEIRSLLEGWSCWFLSAVLHGSACKEQCLGFGSCDWTPKTPFQITGPGLEFSYSLNHLNLLV